MTAGDVSNRPERLAAVRAERLCLSETMFKFEAAPQITRGAAYIDASSIGKAEPYRTERGGAVLE